MELGPVERWGWRPTAHDLVVLVLQRRRPAAPIAPITVSRAKRRGAWLLHACEWGVVAVATRHSRHYSSRGAVVGQHARQRASNVRPTPRRAAANRRAVMKGGEAAIKLEPRREFFFRDGNFWQKNP